MSRMSGLRWSRIRNKKVAMSEIDESRDIAIGAHIAARAAVQRQRYDADLTILELILKHPSFSKLSEVSQKWYTQSLQWLLDNPEKVLRLDFRENAEKTIILLNRISSGFVPEVQPEGHVYRSKRPSPQVMERRRRAAQYAKDRESVNTSSPWLRDSSLLPKKPPGK